MYSIVIYSPAEVLNLVLLLPRRYLSTSIIRAIRSTQTERIVVCRGGELDLLSIAILPPSISSQPVARLDGVGEIVHDRTFAITHREIAKRDRTHCDNLRFINTMMKNGAPKNAVTTPMGVSAPWVSTRPGMSVRIRKAAPSTTVSGSSRR